MVSRFVATALRLDPWLVGAAILLSVAGLINLAALESASSLFAKQVVFVIVGVCIVIGVAMFDYRWFRSSPFLGLAIWASGLILLAFTAFFVQDVRGASNWIFLGPLSIGPIEIVKFGALVVLARYFAREHTRLVFPTRVIFSALVVVIPISLTFLQPDLGSAVVLAALWFWMVLLLRIPLRAIFVIALCVAFLGGIAWGNFLHEYQRERLSAFLVPEKDPFGAAYQSRQATIAAGSGGITGRGLFADDLASNLAFLPESPADFAFAALIERTGFVGGLVMLFAFAILLFRIRNVAMRTTNNFSRAYAIGLFSLVMTETMLNIGMNLGLLPVTGIPLPFVSYGGSHTLATFTALGLLESIRLHQPTFILHDRDAISTF